MQFGNVLANQLGELLPALLAKPVSMKKASAAPRNDAGCAVSLQSQVQKCQAQIYRAPELSWFAGWLGTLSTGMMSAPNVAKASCLPAVLVAIYPRRCATVCQQVLWHRGHHACCPGGA